MNKRTGKPNCNENFDNFSFDPEVIQIVSEGTRSYRCPLCPYESIYSESNVRTHIKHKHTGEKSFSCPECHKCFAMKSTMVRHLRIHTGERPYECKEMFFQETNLEHAKHYEENINDHSVFIDVIQHESGSVRTYRCPFCPYESHHREADVKKHMKYKHTGEKPFICPSCPKRFTEKGNLQKHLVVHTQEKPFTCNTCFKEFKHLKSRDFHIRTQHLMK